MARTGPSSMVMTKEPLGDRWHESDVHITAYNLWLWLEDLRAHKWLLYYQCKRYKLPKTDMPGLAECWQLVMEHFLQLRSVYV